MKNLSEKTETINLLRNMPKGTHIWVHGGNKNKRVSAIFLGFKGNYVVVSKFQGNENWSKPQLITHSEFLCTKEK